MRRNTRDILEVLVNNIEKNVSVLIVGRWAVGWGRKSYLGPAGIASFCNRDFSRSNTHDTFWHVVSTGYFCDLFWWTIAVSDFRCLEIYENLGFPLSAITFTVNHLADNHFYKYIYLFQMLYFMILYFSIFKFDSNVKHRSYFFQ